MLLAKIMAEFHSVVVLPTQNLWLDPTVRVMDSPFLKTRSFVRLLDAKILAGIVSVVQLLQVPSRDSSVLCVIDLVSLKEFVLWRRIMY